MNKGKFHFPPMTGNYQPLATVEDRNALKEKHESWLAQLEADESEDKIDKRQAVYSRKILEDSLESLEKTPLISKRQCSVYFEEVRWESLSPGDLVWYGRRFVNGPYKVAARDESKLLSKTGYLVQGNGIEFKIHSPPLKMCEACD